MLIRAIILMTNALMKCDARKPAHQSVHKIVTNENRPIPAASFHFTSLTRIGLLQWEFFKNKTIFRYYNILPRILPFIKHLKAKFIHLKKMAKDTQSPDYLELKAEIRSVLISSQQGCDEQQLMSDFASFNGRTIPFRQMGYSNLIELLTSMPDVARIDKYKRPIVIHGVADEKTLHIQKFVLGQRSKKSKKPRGGGRTRSNRTNFPIINSVYGPVCCFLLISIRNLITQTYNQSGFFF